MADYHWSGTVQRAFLEALAETGSVQMACDACGKSRRAAYNLRQRAEGQLFAIGWDGAMRLAREVVFDTLMDRAILGQWVETERDKEAGRSRRHSWDRRLGMDLLARLDKMIDASADRTSPTMAATIVARDFGAFLDLVESGDMAAANAFFVSRMADCRYGHYAPADPLFVEQEVKSAPERVRARASTRKAAPKRRKAAASVFLSAVESPSGSGNTEIRGKRELFPLDQNRNYSDAWNPDEQLEDVLGMNTPAVFTSKHYANHTANHTANHCELPQNSAASAVTDLAPEMVPDLSPELAPDHVSTIDSPVEAPADHPTLVPDRPRRLITAPRVVPAIGTRAYANWVRNTIPQW